MKLTPPVHDARKAVKKSIKQMALENDSATPKSSIKQATREIIRTIQTHRLTYDTFRNACHAARAHLGMENPKRPKKLPKLLPDDTFQKYMATIAASGNLQHEIMLKILFYTGVRNEELTNIKLDDVDLPGSRIFIDDGKGHKDRYVLFADQFRSVLRAYMASVTNHVYLFESKWGKPYSTRRIHQIVTGYGKQIGVHVHPHLLRHAMLTHLTKSGLGDSQIQLVSGHASKKSLEKYQHLGLADVNKDYQEAMRKVEMP